MAMPGKPAAPMGAEGQINVDGPIIESQEPRGSLVEDGDDRVPVKVGAQEQGPNSPTHGAAGGLDVDFASVAPIRFPPEPSSSTREQVLSVDLGHPK